jgi:hypothetical protein
MAKAPEWTKERKAVPAALEKNRARRDRADAERRAAHDELRDLLVRGQAVALDVKAMALAAGVSRDTAHRLLREAGSLSFRQKGAAQRDRAASEYIVTTGTVPSQEITVPTYTRAAALAHETNGSWTRVGKSR